jgi:putative peptidoglycan lipid II flippase
LGWFPHGGLALANTLATTLEMIVLLILMRKRLEGLEGRRLLAGVVQAGLAVAIMGVALAGWLAISAELRIWVVVLGGVLVGGLVYGAVLFLLRVPELRLALDWLLAKLRRSPAPPQDSA